MPKNRNLETQNKVMLIFALLTAAS